MIPAVVGLPKDGSVDQEGTDRHSGAVDFLGQVQLGDRSKQHGLTKEDTECHDDQQDHCRPHHRIGCGQQVGPGQRRWR